jgi:acetyl esterase/lipase
VPYAFLAVTLVGALAVLNAYRPIRRQPLNVPSFFAGWVVGELPIQNMAWQIVAAVIFGVFGAFAAWPGDVGLFVAGVSWAGLMGLALVGHRSGRVVADALGGATGTPSPSVTALPAPEWGRWWRLTRAVPLRARSVQVERNLDYWGDGIKRHRLDVIRPRVPPSARPAPVMVYIHGGAWMIGNKEEQGKPMLYELVARGWVCVTINYRLSPAATWPDHIVDCKRAIAWVREHIGEYGGDPSFIALSGGSAGGHLCALAALTANDPVWQPGFEDADTSVDACVPLYGVMEMTGSPTGMGRYGSGFMKMLEKDVMKTSKAEHPEIFERASPTARVHADAPPFFVLHGTNDTLVPVEVAREFVAALREVSSATVAYAELPLAQHAFDVLASLRCQETTAGVVAFLDGIHSSARQRGTAQQALGDQVA